MAKNILWLLLWIPQFVLSFPIVPNPSMTTGEICHTKDPDFSTLRYAQRMPYCERNVSSATKREIYESYHIPVECRRYYTIDHFIPLSIGGNNSKKNLWPEHKLLKKSRQSLETHLYREVSSNRMSQAEAIKTVIYEKLHPSVRPNPRAPDLCERAFF